VEEDQIFINQKKGALTRTKNLKRIQINKLWISNKTLFVSFLIGVSVSQHQQQQCYYPTQQQTQLHPQAVLHVAVPASQLNDIGKWLIGRLFLSLFNLVLLSGLMD
jgi:hypothetical protein